MQAPLRAADYRRVGRAESGRGLPVAESAFAAGVTLAQVHRLTGP